MTEEIITAYIYPIELNFSLFNNPIESDRKYYIQKKRGVICPVEYFDGSEPDFWFYEIDENGRFQHGYSPTSYSLTYEDAVVRAELVFQSNINSLKRAIDKATKELEVYENMQTVLLDN